MKKSDQTLLISANNLVVWKFVLTSRNYDIGCIQVEQDGGYYIVICLYFSNLLYKPKNS